jgi:response regulator of citrate/malate metabolism
MSNTQDQYLKAMSDFRSAQLMERREAQKELKSAIRAAQTAEKRVTRALARSRDAGESLTDLALVTDISRSTIQRRLERDGKLCQSGG